MPKDVFENNSKDFISFTKDTIGVTLATNDDNNLKCKTYFKNQQAFNFKIFLNIFQYC